MPKINLIESKGYEDERLETLQKALQLLEAVLNSEEFKERILNFTTDGRKTFYFRKTFFGKWIDQPSTNQQVYNMIMTAKEEVGDRANGTIDLYLELVNGANGDVIGYGNPSSSQIYTYSIMFDDMSLPDLAQHYAHEWCHKIGFEHAFHRSRNRSNSVPYGIGNIIDRLSHQFMAAPAFATN
jgi:hypothetical protein